MQSFRLVGLSFVLGLLFASAPTDASTEVSGRLTAGALVQEQEFITASPTGYLSLFVEHQATGGLALGLSLHGFINWNAIGLANQSSFLWGSWTPDGWSDGEGVHVAFFPFGAETIHAGFLHPVTWGRTSLTRGPQLQVQPMALRADFKARRGEVWASTRTAGVFNQIEDELVQEFDFTAGGALQPVEWLRADATVAWIPNGLVPSFADQGLEIRSVTRGASARLAYTRGPRPHLIKDLRRFGDEPLILDELLQQHEPTAGLSAWVGVEASALTITLASPDALEPADELGTAAALDARLGVGPLTLNLMVLRRNLTFIQAGVPSIPPFIAFHDDFVLTDDTVVSVAAEYTFAPVPVSAALIGILQQPATLTAPIVLVGSNDPSFLRRILVTGRDQFTLVPADHEVAPIVFAIAQVRYAPHPAVALGLEAEWQRDPNHALFRQDATGVVIDTIGTRNLVRGALLAQLRLP